jgi:hypothetical protein
MFIVPILTYFGASAVTATVAGTAAEISIAALSIFGS